MYKVLLFLALALLTLSESGRAYFHKPRRHNRQSQKCRLPNSQHNGVCAKFSRCQSAQLAYYNYGVGPTICYHDPSDPVVCCPLYAQSTSTNQGHSENLKVQRVCEIKCSELNNSPRLTFVPAIVGGVRTSAGEFSHMAALGWSKTTGAGYEYLCGGSLIARNFVLTAAHCGSIGGAAPDVVRTGGDSLDDTSGLIPDIPISRIIVHPGYRRKQTYNDIALLQLSYNSGHNPACLWPTRGVNYPEVTAVGYGQTQFAGKASKHLLKVVLKIFSNEECKRYYSAGYRLENGIVDSQICVGDPYKVKDTCQGDSGGPIVIKANVKGTEVPYVLGITSFGQGCAGGPPSIYTRVPSYLDWIESIVWPSG